MRTEQELARETCALTFEDDFWLALEDYISNDIDTHELISMLLVDCITPSGYTQRMLAIYKEAFLSWLAAYVKEISTETGYDGDAHAVLVEVLNRWAVEMARKCAQKQI